jgi:outer membrane protease
MKKLCFFIFSAAMIFNLSAKEHDFSIGASFGMLNGRAQEAWYMDTETDNKESELLWDFKPLPYIGLDIKYSWLKPENKWGLFANGLIKFGFPYESGVMEDRDWLISSNPNWLTNYSVHDNKTETAILMDFNLGVSFLIFQKFLLKPYLSYHYMHFSWTASGGSILYARNSIYDPVYSYYYPSTKNVATYEQTWHIFSPAISFYGEFNRFFDIEIAFEATPLIWCLAKDNHIDKNWLITDNPIYGIFIEPSVLFSYKPMDHFVLSFSFTYRDINKSRGDTLYKKPSSNEFFKNRGGAGYTAADIGIIAKYKF